MDTLDDLIRDGRIQPQLAMRILGNFDQSMTEALQKNVRARMSFKVRAVVLFGRAYICVAFGKRLTGDAPNPPPLFYVCAGES